MQIRFKAAAGAVALMLAVVALPAHALTQVSRDTTTVINILSPDFSDATAQYDNRMNLGTDAGSQTFGVSIVPAATGIYFSGVDATTATPGSAPDGTTAVDVLVDSPGGAGQGWEFGYVAAVGNAPGESLITRSFVDGQWVLDFSGGGFNFVDLGGTFTSTVKITGDWTTRHQLFGVGGGYSILDNFSFDGEYTIFSVQTESYDGTNPSIAFRLSDVPEPETYALMLVGLALLGAVSRRRRT